MITARRSLLLFGTLFIGIMVIAACGYLKVFDGSLDEKITWTQTSGYKTEVEAIETVKSCAGTLNQANIVFAEGDSSSSVTQNFELPQRLNECVISWSADASASSWVSLSEGIASVTRPEGSTDASVTLTANVSLGQAFESKNFSLTIKGKTSPTGSGPGTGGGGTTSASELAACKSNLTSDKITFAAGESLTSVSQNFTLPRTQSTCSVSWSASDTTWVSNINSSTGVATVSRQQSASNQVVTLTATLTHSASGTTDSKTFSITILKILTDAVVDSCAAAVDIGDLNFTSPDTNSSVTQNFTLPSSVTVSGDVCALTWSEAPDSSAVAISGNSVTVTRPAYVSGDAAVTLRATASGGSAYTKQSSNVNFTVAKVPATDLEKANECRAGFSASNITFTSPDTSAAITKNFTLPSSATISGHTCTLSSWQSNNAAISLSGTSATVVRPADDSSNATVTLSGTVSVNGTPASSPVSVAVTVAKYTEAESVTACSSALTTDDFTGLNSANKNANSGVLEWSTTSITFPTTKSGVGGVTCSVSWSSDQTSYLSVSGGTGTATHEYDAAHTNVILAATISRGSAPNGTKNFTMQVKSKFLPPAFRFTAAEAGTSQQIKVVYPSSSFANPADTNAIVYKVCVSKTASDLQSISAMDAMTSGCQTENIAYPETPLIISITTQPGESWYARVYSTVSGQANETSKKILYNLSSGVNY